MKETLLNAAQTGDLNQLMKVLEDGKLIKALMCIPFIGKLIKGIRWSFFVLPAICARDENHKTVLMYAIKNDHREIVEMLLETGAAKPVFSRKTRSLHYSDSNKALMYAAKNDRKEISEMLLKSGYINASSFFSHMMCYIAGNSYVIYKEGIKMLLEVSHTHCSELYDYMAAVVKYEGNINKIYIAIEPLLSGRQQESSPLQDVKVSSIVSGEK